MTTKTIIVVGAICGLIMAITPCANATTQSRDRLEIGGQVHYVLGSDIPRDLLYGTNGQTFIVLCSSCWRGFHADWKIHTNRLYLVSARQFDGSLFSGMTNTNGLVYASWFSGKLFSPKVCVWFLPSDLIGGVYLGNLEFHFDKGKFLTQTFEVNPVGIGILLAELVTLFLLAVWILRGWRQRTAQRLLPRLGAALDR